MTTPPDWESEMSTLRLLPVLAAALFLVSACAKLQVQVDVADATEVRAAMALNGARDDLVAVASQGEAELNAEAGAMKAQVDTLFDDLSSAYLAIAQTRPAGDARELYARQGRTYAGASPAEADINTAIDRWRDEAIVLSQTVRHAYAASDASDRWYAAGPLARALAARQALDRDQLAAIRSELEGIRSGPLADLRGRVPAAPAASSGPPALAGAPDAAAEVQSAAVAGAQTAIEAAEDSLSAAITTVDRSIIADGSLVGSGFAYSVASLDEQFWRRRFNQARGMGFFGNSNIVIRMNQTGDFSVKGMTFDANSVAAVASKAATQAVLLGAQIAGAPVTSQPTGSSSNGLVSASARLVQARDSVATAQAREDARRLALMELGFAVLNEQGAVESGDREAAAAAISAVYTELAPLLRLEAGAGDPEDQGE